MTWPPSASRSGAGSPLLHDRDATAGAALHRSRWLGALRHLQVRLPRRNRTQRRTSCVPGAPVSAECHPTRGCGEDPSLQVPGTQERPPQHDSKDRSGTGTRERPPRAVSTDGSGTLTPEASSAASSRVPRADMSVVPALERAPRVTVPETSARAPENTPLDLHVQHSTGAVARVRSGTCRCTCHAGCARSGAARAYRVSLQVRNATQRGAPVRICHSRCR